MGVKLHSKTGEVTEHSPPEGEGPTEVKGSTSESNDGSDDKGNDP